MNNQLNQLMLNLKSNNNTLIVDTSAQPQKKTRPANLGMILAAKAMHADTCHWKDYIPNIKQYNTIGFSVIYPLYVLNIAPFLKRHNIPPKKINRKYYDLIVGGKGGTNIAGALNNIATTFKGEAEGNYTDENGWKWMKELTSPPVIYGNKAIIELTRGCKYKCRFCEYAHVTGGPYREKPLNLLKKQLYFCKGKQISIRTANIAGYSQLFELVQLVKQLNVYVPWGDIAIKDAHNILPLISTMRIKNPKIGVESFDENTRKTIGKHFSDDMLRNTINELMKQCSIIHIFLIYGMPNDNYSKWFEWVYTLANMRKQFKHPIRINFNITNFNPTPGTPMQNDPWVNFQNKKYFLKEWINTCKNAGFYKQTWNVKPGNDFGYHGRNEGNYKLIMMLRTAGPILTDKIINTFPNGVERSIRGNKAWRFVNN